MRIVLSDHIFNEDNTYLLLTLLRVAKLRGHIVKTRPAWKSTDKTRQSTQWVDKQPEQIKRYIINLLDDHLSHESPKTKVTITVSNQQSPPFYTRLEDSLIEWLMRPLQVYVENDQDDWEFIKKSIHPNWIHLFTNAITNGNIVPANGGGITNLTSKIQKQISLDYRLYTRTWVLMDSDRTCAQDPPSLASNECQKACKDANIPAHQLKYRAIENYVPAHILMQWAQVNKDRGDWLTEFQMMTPEQQQYYKLKEKDKGGFGKHNNDRPRISTHTTKVYGQRLNNTSSLLWEGPPGNIGKLWSEQNISYTNFGSDVQNELDTIYQSILEAL